MSALLPDRFEVKGELGRGGMGVVYRAYDRESQRPVAIKVLPASVGAGSLTQRFVREGQQLSELSHPNVVAFYAAGCHRDRDYLVMELAEGGNLLNYLRQPRSVEDLVGIFRQLCGGLEHIHSRGLVHRDLKPENILLSSDGTPKISDFGLARRVEGSSRLTAEGAIVGTYSYLAPEQIASSSVSSAADLYALGAVMYEAFTGRPVFEAATEYELLQCHVRQVPVSPRALRSDLPPRLERLIMRLLRKNPRDRPHSALEVAGLLETEPAAQEFAREPLLVTLEEALSRCLAGQAASCLLTAPHGLGRSRMVWELSERLTARGLRVLLLIPEGGAILQVGRLYGALGGEGDRLGQCLVSGGASAGAESLRLKLASHPRTVLLVDDGERLDATSRAILQELARRTPAPATGWLLSMSCESLPASSWPESALAVELPALSYDEMCELALEHLGKPRVGLASSLGDWLALHAGGSPRLLRILVTGLVRGEFVERREGLWKETRPLPADPCALVLAELASLEDEPLQILKAASILQEPFSLEALRALSQPEPENHLNRLVGQGLLEETPTGLFRFASTHLRQHLFDNLPERIQRHLFGLLAQQAGGPARALYLSRAEHPAQAVPLLLEEAERCQTCGAFAESYDLWQQSLACLSRDASSQLRLRILQGSGEALVGCGRIEQGVAQLEAVVAEARSGLPEERVIRLAAWRALVAAQQRRGLAWAGLLNLSRQGLLEAGLPAEPASGPGDPELQRQSVGIYLVMARTQLQRGELQLAQRLIPGALGLARHCQDRAREAELLVLEGCLHRLEGRSQACEQSLFKSLRLAQESLGPGHTLQCQLELARLYVSMLARQHPQLQAATLEKAEMSLSQALQLADELADSAAQAGALTEQAWLLEARAQRAAALERLAEACRRVEEEPESRAYQESLLAWAYLRQGEVRRAEELLRQGLSSPEPFASTWVLGHLFRQEGRDSEAQEWFQRALQAADENPLQSGRARVGLALALRSQRSTAARTHADLAVRSLERSGGYELGLARWAQGRVRVSQGDEAAGGETLRLAERLLGGDLPPLELLGLVEEARQDLKAGLRRLSAPVGRRPAAEVEEPARPRPPEPIVLKGAPAPTEVRLAVPGGRPQTAALPRRSWWRSLPLGQFLVVILLFLVGVGIGIYTLPRPLAPATVLERETPGPAERSEPSPGRAGPRPP